MLPIIFATQAPSGRSTIITANPASYIETSERGTNFTEQSILPRDIQETLATALSQWQFATGMPRCNEQNKTSPIFARNQWIGD